LASSGLGAAGRARRPLVAPVFGNAHGLKSIAADFPVGDVEPAQAFILHSDPLQRRGIGLCGDCERSVHREQKNHQKKIRQVNFVCHRFLT